MVNIAIFPVSRYGQRNGRRGLLLITVRNEALMLHKRERNSTMQIFSDSDDLPMKAEKRAETSLLKSLFYEDVAMNVGWVFIILCVLVIAEWG